LQPDIVIALGSAHTFLRAQSYINNNSTPLLGVRTKSELHQGSLSKLTVTEKQRTKIIPMILEALDDESCVTKYNRTRLVFESTMQGHKSTMNEEDL